MSEILFSERVARPDCGSINSRRRRAKRRAIHFNVDMHAEMKRGLSRTSVIGDLINFTHDGGSLPRNINLGSPRSPHQMSLTCAISALCAATGSYT